MASSSPGTWMYSVTPRFSKWNAGSLECDSMFRRSPVIRLSMQITS